MTFPFPSHYLPLQNSGPCDSFYCLGHFKNVYDDDNNDGVLSPGWLGSPVVSVQKSPGSVIAAATLSGNRLRQTVHTHRASVHRAAKLVAAPLRVARATAGLAESSGSLPPGL